MKRQVVFLSGRETDYIRNRVLLAALRMNYRVDVLNSPGRGAGPATCARALHRIAGQPDDTVVFTGFHAQPLTVALAIATRRPIVMDAYLSVFDTVCYDRRWFSPHSPAGRIAYWLDARSCQSARQIITDTEANARYFCETFAVDPAKLTAIYVGCDEALFSPRPADGGRAGTRVFYYGAFLPLHGAETIVRAAALLQDRPDVRLTIGGDGGGAEPVQRLAAELGLRNIDFVGWIPLERLPDYIAEADICLGGHYSTVPKAARVIATKAFQFVAMRKATILGDNCATREVFTPGDHVLAVPMGDPRALAEAIRLLADDPGLRERLAAAGYARFQDRLSTAAIAERVACVIESV